MVSFDLPVITEVQNRIVYKNGEVNLTKENIGHHKKYFKDILFTILDLKWKYLLLAFALAFLLSWTVFGTLWYLMAYIHGDIAYYEKWLAADNKEEFEMKSGHTPCVRNLYTYVSAFLYSIETQNTGYGFRHVTIECAGGPFILILQLFVGMLIQALTIGIIIAKLTKPRKSARNILFSRHAVICHRDGAPVLMIRIADIKKTCIVQASVKARLIRRIYSKQGELLEFHQDNLPMSVDNCDNKIMLLWPTLVYHRIDAKSPLWEMTAQDLQRAQFEILVMLEGGIESTGLQTQARTSYLPCEILWGHRFQSVLMPKEKQYNNEIDYNFFDNTFPVSIPQCAAKDLIKTICIHDHLPEECECAGFKEDNHSSVKRLRAMFSSKYY